MQRVPETLVFVVRNRTFITKNKRGCRFVGLNNWPRYLASLDHRNAKGGRRSEGGSEGGSEEVNVLKHSKHFKRFKRF